MDAIDKSTANTSRNSNSKGSEEGEKKEELDK
jgi:hypothetical protein